MRFFLYNPISDSHCVTPKLFLLYRPGWPDDVPSGDRANYLWLPGLGSSTVLVLGTCT